MQDAVDSILAAFLLPKRDLQAARAARTLPAFHIVSLSPEASSFP